MKKTTLPLGKYFFLPHQATTHQIVVSPQLPVKPLRLKMTCRKQAEAKDTQVYVSSVLFGCRHISAGADVLPIETFKDWYTFDHDIVVSPGMNVSVQVELGSELPLGGHYSPGGEYTSRAQIEVSGVFDCEVIPYEADRLEASFDPSIAHPEFGQHTSAQGGFPPGFDESLIGITGAQRRALRRRKHPAPKCEPCNTRLRVKPVYGPYCPKCFTRYPEAITP
jgi:hypothetical protein